MNTDNMTISGETIDYGPCAFMDSYDPKTVFSSIDHQGRYAYFNQPGITKWNLSRFAETLVPLINKDENKAIEIANEIINNFDELYKKSWFLMMRNKLGLFGEEIKDENLISDLLKWMKQNNADYTNTFCSIMNEDIKKNKIFQNSNFINWFKTWENRISQNNKSKDSSLNLMQKNNPLVIPRNHIVEKTLEAANNEGNLKPLKDMLKYLKKPYKNQPGILDFQNTPTSNGKKYITFCGT